MSFGLARPGSGHQSCQCGSNTLEAIQRHFEDLQNGKRRALEMDGFSMPVVVPMTWPHPGMPEQRLLAAVNSVDRSEFTQTALALPPSSGQFILCAACDASPDWIYPTMRVRVPGILYQILSAEVRIDGFRLRLHALDAPA
jgi:hypothetical protein